MTTADYIFTSKRLGFRKWQESDLAPMAAVNADAEVMQYFPSTQTKAHTRTFIDRMNIQLEHVGYCYYAVDLLMEGEFIGFIGLSYQEYAAPFTPCTDIGWRLARSHWGNGYATEGALTCLAFAFERLHITKVYAVSAAGNTPSIKVMEKLGMQYECTFDHPALKDSPTLRSCVAYTIARPQHSRH